MKKKNVVIIGVVCVIVICLSVFLGGLSAFFIYEKLSYEDNNTKDNKTDSFEHNTPKDDNAESFEHNTPEDDNAESFEYKKTSHIYILPNESFENMDTLYNVCSELLLSKDINDIIKKTYPDTEYKIELNHIKDTEIFEINIMGNIDEHLLDICNMATDLFCKKVENTTNSHCYIIDYAK